MRDVPLSSEAVDKAIATALRDLRGNLGLTARQLAELSGVSAAMISRIENEQASPSLSSLVALARALDVPLVSLFRETASDHTDFTHVAADEGLRSTRIVGGHSHEFVNLAFHTRRDLQFEARMVTLVRQKASPPTYIGHGVVFIYVVQGEALYAYGPREILLKAGDSLSIDAELAHGFKRVVSPKFTFLTVQSERRR